MLEEGRGSCRWSAVFFVRAQVFSSAFEEAMRWSAWAGMADGYCALVGARLCSFEHILPHRKWA